LSELKELAMSMGMYEDEWNQFQIKSETSLKLARNHSAVQNLDEAIREAKKAKFIYPYLANRNSILAKSHQILWLADQNEQARTKAIYHAQKELLTDPEDQVAINALNAVNKDQKNGLADAKTNKSKQKESILVTTFIPANEIRTSLKGTLKFRWDLKQNTKLTKQVV
jgi:tetratricopeptide (TPR) repeat protein